ncbi:hypothetical protein GCM10009754_85900 [Amycolatopsis minnesotensis]|uniref:Replication initiator protein n=1 Tax=Amycolatopsis minnesotensis TaxID=337894 RepID=A0ABP5EDI8_9PSEU
MTPNPRESATPSRQPAAGSAASVPDAGSVPAAVCRTPRAPLTADVVKATAEKHGVCTRPFTMEVADNTTGELRFVPVPCGSTVESVCLPCARKAKALRQQQCREGWHRDTEPETAPAEAPSEAHTELLEFRADLVARFRELTGAEQLDGEGQA